MSNAKTFDGVAVRQLTHEEYRDLPIDSPELTARREARIASDGDDIVVTLKQGEWRTIIPTVSSNLAEGIAHLKMAQRMVGAAREAGDLKGDELAEAEKALAHDVQVAQVMRHVLGEVMQQVGENSADPFFAVDGKMMLQELDKLFGEYIVTEAAIESIFHPANVRAEMEMFAERGRAEERDAQAEVDDLLARFAQDTDSSGHTIN